MNYASDEDDGSSFYAEENSDEYFDYSDNEDDEEIDEDEEELSEEQMIKEMKNNPKKIFKKFCKEIGKKAFDSWKAKQDAPSKEKFKEVWENGAGIKKKQTLPILHRAFETVDCQRKLTVKPCIDAIEEMLEQKYDDSFTPDEIEESRAWAHVQACLCISLFIESGANEANFETLKKAIDPLQNDYRLGNKGGKKGFEKIRDLTTTDKLSNYAEKPDGLCNKDYLRLLVFFAKNIFPTFRDDMEKLTEDMDNVEFQANYKKVARVLQKYKSLKKDPKYEDGDSEAYDHIWDILRCTYYVESDDIEDVFKIYDYLHDNFKIVRVKNKMNTELQNLTINFVYYSIIAEVQICYNIKKKNLAANHLIYELRRVENLEDLATVIVFNEKMVDFLTYVDKNKKSGLKNLHKDWEEKLVELAKDLKEDNLLVHKK